MSEQLTDLWLIPAHSLQWAGALLGLCALLLLADLVWEHWQAGREIDDDRAP